LAGSRTNWREFSDFHFGAPSDGMIARAAEKIGYPFPASYVELLKPWNGGVISDDLDESWLSTIYGVAPMMEVENGLEAMFDNWRDEWEYWSHITGSREWCIPTSLK